MRTHPACGIEKAPARGVYAGADACAEESKTACKARDIRIATTGIRGSEPGKPLAIVDRRPAHARRISPAPLSPCESLHKKLAYKIQCRVYHTRNL